MPDLIAVLTADEIEKATRLEAQTISFDELGCEHIFSGALKNALFFMSDFVRQLSIAVKNAFLRAASYGSSSFKSGKILLKKDLKIDEKKKCAG